MNCSLEVDDTHSRPQDINGEFAQSGTGEG